MFQILALHGIGKVRAVRIVTARNAGQTISTLDDLADIVGLNEKNIVKFLRANASDLF